MRIGIFDSGLGGLIITRAIIKRLPKYDYVYLGDTKRLPYGNRSQAEILKFTKEALEYLFGQDCKLVIIACNTSSAKALRKIQREFLPKHYPGRKVLGVIVPTVEVVAAAKDRHAKVGIISTTSTTNSHAYKRELLKLHPGVKVFEAPAPKLVPLIEADKLSSADIELKRYLKPLLAKKIDTLVLGCTHYPILKKQAAKIAGRGVTIISQDNIIPAKLENYLKRHKEIEKQLSRQGKREFLVTDIKKGFTNVSKRLFGKNIALIKV